MSDIVCAVIADDLTGACDAAVHFARRGLSTQVGLGSDFARTCVLSVSTETRNATETEIAARLRSMAANLKRYDPKILFKKIDSTLRGKEGLEIGVLMDAFECDLAVVTPAFPALGRVVRDGRLCVDADSGFEPVEVLAHLSKHREFDSGRALTFDAICREDLRNLTSHFLNAEKRIFWAGSGGLADALAAELFGEETQPQLMPFEDLPLVFCIGSAHHITKRQEAEFVGRRGVPIMRAETASPREIPGAILRITHGETSPALLRDLLSKAASQIGGLFLCGGDTAALVCHAIGAQRIELIDELLPGVPFGTLRGGICDRKAVVTKSGGFGNPDTLVRVAQEFAVQV